RRGAVGEARDRYGDQTASGLRAAARGRVRPQGLPAAVRVDGDPRQGLLAEPAQGPGRTAVSGMEETNWTRGGLHFRDVTFAAAFDHFGRAQVSVPDTLSVFARIISTEANSDKPYLVFLQGGPGVEAPRPVTPVGADPVGRTRSARRPVPSPVSNPSVRTPPPSPRRSPASGPIRSSRTRRSCAATSARTPGRCWGSPSAVSPRCAMSASMHPHSER